MYLKKRCEIEGWLQWTTCRKPPPAVYSLLRILFANDLTLVSLNFCITFIHYLRFARCSVLCFSFWHFC